MIDILTKFGESERKTTKQEDKRNGRFHSFREKYHPWLGEKIKRTELEGAKRFPFCIESLRKSYKNNVSKKDKERNNKNNN